MLDNTDWLASLLWLNFYYRLEPETPAHSSFFMSA